MNSIAIICKTLLKGGAEKQALILARYLQEKDFNVYIINWDKNEVDPENLRYIKENGIRYFFLNGGHLLKLINLTKIIKKENTQIIVSYLTLANLVAGIVKLIVKNLKTIGGIRNEKLPYYKFVIERLIHNYINDFTVFNNYSGSEKFSRKGFNPSKINVIQNAIEIQDRNTKDYKIVKDEIRIVTVGRFVKQKDYPTALRSFKLLKEEFTITRLKYIVIGYGPLEKEIRSIVQSMGLESDVQIMINPPNISEILRNSDIFLSTSLFEGVSNAIMEAMVAGLPIVATEVGDNKYLIKNSYNGYLVPCGNIRLLMQKLKYLCESAEKRTSFGKNNQLILEKDFSISKMVNNYILLFKKLEDKLNHLQ